MFHADKVADAYDSNVTKTESGVPTCDRQESVTKRASHIFPWGYPKNDGGSTAMSKKAAEHHKQSQEHHTHAARHHGEAAKHHESGQHEKAAHHAHTARGHALHARNHSDLAAMAHMEEHGKK
jgi:hypothetical protein